MDNKTEEAFKRAVAGISEETPEERFKKFLKKQKKDRNEKEDISEEELHENPDEYLFLFGDETIKYTRPNED